MIRNRLLRRALRLFSGRTARMSIAAVMTFAAVGLILPSPALAAGKPWAVTVMSAGDNPVPLGKAYGDFANNGGVYATAGINFVDMNNNGIPVFVEVKFYFWYKGPASTEESWQLEASKQTDRTQRMKYVSTERSTPLLSKSSKARAEIKVCEDRDKAFDRCSRPAFVNFDY